jgi:hypothetical protein
MGGVKPDMEQGHWVMDSRYGTLAGGRLSIAHHKFPAAVLLHPGVLSFFPGMSGI